jgi:nucleotide-binding universal stress UspA family protein
MNGMYDRILIPVDGSECGRQAATYGFALADATDATVDLVHVVDTTIGTVGARMTESERRDHGETILESTVELAEEFDCPVETHLHEGSPASEIVASAALPSTSFATPTSRC